ncbi:hypothetical protein [Streptomyces sp. NBC_00258]|uniref:hypothetical protein n=1 Tax=Streptomyces sp. NBC_00258 TaxID=2903642 RepID=UPI002E2E501D|nr:hypothetical protein [Streptomyces sp. NBC_00258]
MDESGRAAAGGRRRVRVVYEESDGSVRAMTDWLAGGEGPALQPAGEGGGVGSLAIVRAPAPIRTKGPRT